MNQVIGEILPMAVAVLISPIPIAAEIILLFSDRPRPNALAYGIGFVVGVGAFLGVLTLIASATDLSDTSSEPAWMAWVRIGLGVLLVFGGIRRFLARPAPGEAEAPKWMDGLETFTPGRSLAVGLGVGALNPKNIVVGIAAAATISAGLSGDSIGSYVVVIAAYAVIASLGVLTPLAVALAMGTKADDKLREWRVWLVDNNAAVMAVIFVVIGAVLAGKGIASL